ncbi:MAG: ergothioneine biosynthesis protein EgtB [Thalassobaculum sp.]|uniref:ergothioneine biosynthesis protein EgtB n=1 Tax=Thalassobaculum sp. TaxID=2022740 RepID=UPI0032ED2A3F
MSDRRSALAELLDAGRTRTLALFAPLDREHLVRQPDPIMSPPVWDLGHIAAYEELWLLRRLDGRPARHPELDALYDAFETPRAQRGDAPLLPPEQTREFMDDVREGVHEVLGRADLGPDAPPLTREGFVFRMVAEHEAQHTETMLQCMRLLPAGVYTPPGRRPLPPGSRNGGPAWIEIPGGDFAMGTDGPEGYDCERPAHRREVSPYRIARDPVSNAEHLAFMADGGYERPEFWSHEGWEWVRSSGARAPEYWEPDGEGGWIVRTFELTERVDPEGILCHVCAHEADAHAAWAGARLPTEAEWERAAQGARCEPAYANLDQLAFGPGRLGSVAPSGEGLRHMMGDVWEWTASTFDGYPGFAPFPYKEYSEVFFGPRYRVLRGGSWATRPCATRATFRNWDLPQRRQIFCGMRLAKDA